MRAFTLSLVAISITCLTGCGGRLNIAEKLQDIDPVVYRYDFIPDLPYKQMVSDIRSAAESERPESARLRSFEVALNQVNYAVFTYASDRFELTGEERKRVLSELAAQSDRIAEVFFTDFVSLHEEEDHGTYEEVFTYKTYGAVRSFARVMSKRLCSLASIIIPFLVGNPEAGVAAPVLSRPCEVLLAEALNPIIEALEDQALIEDHVACRLRITEHVRKMILELSVVEDEFKADFQTTYRRKIFFDLLTSEADLSAKYEADVKAGFDLKKYFAVDIDESQHTMVVTLPQPEILSVDIRPTISHMEDGWFIEIEENHINEAIAVARQRIANRALDSGILMKAKENAKVVVDRILAPLASTPAFRYNIELRFADHVVGNKPSIGL